MKIKLVKPHSDYPFAWMHVDVSVNTDREDLGDILAENCITLLGRWEPHMSNGVVESVKAPVLMEDEHIKPQKKRARSRKK